MTTGELIQKHREAAGLSRKELAEAAGIPLRTLEKLEQGVISEPKLVDIASIAECVGKTCADFVTARIAAPTAPTLSEPKSKRK